MRLSSTLTAQLSFVVTLLIVLAFSSNTLAQSQSGAQDAAPSGRLDPAKLPDISGLHLGVSLVEAKAVMQKWYPRGVAVTNGGPFGPQHQTPVGTFRATADGGDEAGVDLTMPPNAQVVWHVSRRLPQPKVAHNVLVAGLRQKYGKETYAAGPGGMTTDDNRIQQMWWVFDEQGHLASQSKIINATPFGCGSFYNADGSFYSYQKITLGQDDGLSTYCHSSYVGVQATMSNDPILNDIYLDIVDLPLMVRSAKATAAWANGMNDKARQQELEREKQTKPQL